MVDDFSFIIARYIKDLKTICLSSNHTEQYWDSAFKADEL